jgi:hypothetical protein
MNQHQQMDGTVPVTNAILPTILASSATTCVAAAAGAVVVVTAAGVGVGVGVGVWVAVVAVDILKYSTTNVAHVLLWWVT